MYQKNNNLFEKILTSKNIHDIEDYLRSKLLSSNEIKNTEIIILARILWGRLINSSKCISGKLDSRHSKAQMITLLCIAFYISYEIYSFKKIISYDLYKLYQFHFSKIEDYIKSISIDILDEKDKKYYKFCFKSIEYCYSLLNIDITQNILNENKAKILLIINVPTIYKIEINNKILSYIKKLKIDDFIKC